MKKSLSNKQVLNTKTAQHLLVIKTPKPQKLRNLSIRTFQSGTGKVVGGFDITNVPPARAAMIKRAYAKALAKLYPGLGMRAVEQDAKSTKGKVKVSMPAIRIFGKKPGKKKK